MEQVGVVGAGTMGGGIAQAAAQAGLRVLLYDVGLEALAAGLNRIQGSLERLVQRGKLSTPQRDAILERIITTTSLQDFSGVDFVIEAAPELLDLKRELFRDLDAICRPSVILATNTSSLSVTEIAALTGRQDLVVGLHFFNPVPLMKLVEVVRGARTSPETAERTTDLARRLGKNPVQAKDTPGFIVNRIARPFPGEALRLLGENVAGVQQIDRILKLAGGFRMGPFELMDLVGMDVNFAVNKSVFEQFFYEPRFRPHPLQAQMVKANLLGRKTGAGWYQYEGDQPIDGPKGPEFAGNPAARSAEIERVCVVEDPAMAELVRLAGYSLVERTADADVVVWGNPWEIDECPYKDGALILAEATMGQLETLLPPAAPLGRVVGYGGVPSLMDRQITEVAVGLHTETAAWQLAVAFFHSLGRDTEVIHASPGLVAPRVIACLINEAAYALMEGVAAASDIDTAMKLGVNYPHGPLEWADAIGVGRVVNILQSLQDYTGEDRYRPCPLLKKLAWAERRFDQLEHPIQSSYSA